MIHRNMRSRRETHRDRRRKHNVYGISPSTLYTFKPVPSEVSHHRDKMRGRSLPKMRYRRGSGTT